MPYLDRVPTCTMSWLVAVAVLCCSTMGQSKCPTHLQMKTHTVGSRFMTVHFMTIHFYDPCRVGPSTPNLWFITVATEESFLYLVCF